MLSPIRHSDARHKKVFVVTRYYETGSNALNKNGKKLGSSYNTFKVSALRVKGEASDMELATTWEDEK